MINKRWGAAALATCAVLALSPATQAAERGVRSRPRARAPPSPRKSVEISRSAVQPLDEVGPVPRDYAKQQLAGVTVQLDTTSFDPQKFAAQAASGNVPDLLQMDRSVVATLADKDLIVPMDECYRSTALRRPAVLPVDGRRRDLRRQGLRRPQFFQPHALMANKRVLEKAGVSLDQLDTSKPDQIVSVAEKLAEQKGATPRCSASTPTCPARRTCGSRSSAAAPTTRPASPPWTTRTTCVRSPG
jgi:multiple sugar transport system substrate-binding protein